MNKFLNCLIVVSYVVIAVNAGHSSEQQSDFVCSEAGRFSDEQDSSCRRYFHCASGKNGWVQTSYSCPEGTVFDRSSHLCSSLAQCHHHQDDSSSSSSSSSEYDGDDFICHKEGTFDDKQDPFCTKYYECKKSHKGELFAVQYPCPHPSKFDPHKGHCTNHYQCPRKFQCTRVGRFEDGTDEYNKRYYLCVKKRNGAFVSTIYTCPLYSVFDAEYEICDIRDESNADADQAHDHSLPSENWEHLDHYVCKARGYFDKGCRDYYFCDVSDDNVLIKYILDCPENYGWDADRNLCSKHKNCD